MAPARSLFIDLSKNAADPVNIWARGRHGYHFFAAWIFDKSRFRFSATLTESDHLPPRLQGFLFI
jgi:hypothetical protein